MAANFEDWIKEIRRLMIEKYQFPSGEFHNNTDWKFYFDLGYKPDDAIIEEFGHF